MIRILDDKEILSINASEIINSYYTVVKELVENSIDAQSTEITVHLYKEQTKVQDNGQGMNYEDLLNCTKCNATSKFKGIDSICSLGFRGKALYILNSIGDLTIFTKKIDGSMGYKYKNSHVEPHAMNNGTTVIVEKLFHNLSHEKKFIRPFHKDKNAIVNMIEHYSFIFPHINFKLYINRQYIPLNREIPLGSPRINIEKLLHNLYYFNCKIIFNDKIHKIIINVNNRMIVNTKFYQAMKDILANYFGKRIFFLYLSIHCAPNYINCNIEPSKTSVLFENSQLWQEIIDEIGKHIKSSVNKKHQTKLIVDNNIKFKEDDVQFLYIKNNKYIFLICQGEIICIDQHAAHERIVAEELKHKPIEKQLLLTPIIINNIHIDHYKMQQLFEFSLIKDKIVITAIPTIIPEQQILYFLNTWNGEDPLSFLFSYIHEYGCKNSLRAGDVLSPIEAIELYKKLIHTDCGHICNHGRPTIFNIDDKFLDNLFLRS